MVPLQGGLLAPPRDRRSAGEQQDRGPVHRSDGRVRYHRSRLLVPRHRLRHRRGEPIHGGSDRRQDGPLRHPGPSDRHRRRRERTAFRRWRGALRRRSRHPDRAGRERTLGLQPARGRTDRRIRRCHRRRERAAPPLSPDHARLSIAGCEQRRRERQRTQIPPRLGTPARERRQCRRTHAERLQRGI